MPVKTHGNDTSGEYHRCGHLDIGHILLRIRNFNDEEGFRKIKLRYFFL